jgi:hypothetical protein
MSDLDDSTLRALAIPPDILAVDEDEMRTQDIDGTISRLADYLTIP